MLRTSRRRQRLGTPQSPFIAVILFLSFLLITAVTAASAQSEFQQFLDTAYRRHAAFEDSLVVLREFDRERLALEDQLSYDLFEWYLEDQILYWPIALSDVDACDVPYAELLKHHTTTTLSAEELFDLLSADVEKNSEAVHEILQQAGIDGASMSEQMAIVEDLGRQKTIGGNNSVADEMQGYVDTAMEALREYFVHYPTEPAVVTPVAGLLALAGLRWGSEAAGRPSQVQIQPGIDGVPYYLRRTIAYHEAFPGHYVQEYNQRLLRSLPAFRQQANLRAYGEAWALYGEQLAWEMGLYRSADPLHKLGFVESKLRRSSLSMMDVAVNGLGWSLHDAEAYLLETLDIDEEGARDAVNRMIDNPGAATSSYIGYLCYLSFRERMQAALGEAFRLVDFHSLVLEVGPVPMEILERVVDEYIDASV